MRKSGPMTMLRPWAKCPMKVLVGSPESATVPQLQLVAKGETVPRHPAALGAMTSACQAVMMDRTNYLMVASRPLKLNSEVRFPEAEQIPGRMARKGAHCKTCITPHEQSFQQAGIHKMTQKARWART